METRAAANRSRLLKGLLNVESGRQAPKRCENVERHWKDILLFFGAPGGMVILPRRRSVDDDQPDVIREF